MAEIRIPSKIELKLIKEYIRYDSESGKLFWLKRAAKRVYIGDELNSIDSRGYYRQNFKYKSYYAHRIAWFLYYNQWPIKDIDHINGIKTDNRIENLRLVTHSVNMQNRVEHRNGIPVGVHLRKDINKWQATAPYNFLDRKNGRYKYLGYYDTMEEAAQVVIDFCKKEKRRYGRS